MILIPYSKTRYILKNLSKQDFNEAMLRLIKPEIKDYYWYFFDSKKPFRGILDEKTNLFTLERNVGTYRGIKINYFGHFTFKEDKKVEVIIEASTPKLFAIFLYVILIPLLSIANYQYVHSILPLFFVAFFFHLVYYLMFWYESSIIAKGWEDSFKIYIVEKKKVI